MEKKWYFSKAKLSAAAIVLINCINQIAQLLGYSEIHIPHWVQEVLVGTGIFGIRDAIKKDEKAEQSNPQARGLV